MADDKEYLCSCNVIHDDIIKAARKEMEHEETMSEMAEFFKVFSDPTRLKIINALLLSEMCVCDLSALIGINQSSVSHHLKTLRAARVIKPRREGKVVYYSLCDDHINTIFKQGLTHVGE